MSPKRVLFFDLLCEAQALFCFCAVFAVLCAAAGFGGAYAFSHVLFAPALGALLAVRRKIKRLALFLCFNALPLPLGLIFTSLSARALYFGFALALAFYSFRKRLSRRARPAALFACAVNAAACLISDYARLGAPRYFFVANAAAAIICAFSAENMQNADGLQSVFSGSAYLPKARIRRFNDAAVVCSACLCCAVAALSARARLNFLPSLLSGVLALPVKALFYILKLLGGGAPAEEVSARRPEGGAPFAFGGAPSAFIAALEKIVVFLACAAALCAFAAVVASALVFIYKTFYEKSRGNKSGADELSDADFKEPAERPPALKKARFWFLPDKNARIRRAFYKKVKRFINKGLKIKNADTARDISRKALKFEDIGKLTALYEKARYGKK